MALYDSEAEKASLAEAVAGNSRPADPNTANNEIEVQSKNCISIFAMRRKKCIFAAKYAENNICIIRTKTGGYVFMGT